MRLRALRESRGLSLRGLAEASGLSPNALSLIERNRVSPSVSTLNRVALALEVPITAFFETSAARRTVVYVKGAERTRVAFSRGLLEALGGESFTGRAEPFHLTLETGGSSGRGSVVHTGDEFVICLRGTLEYTVENDVYTLEAGDSLPSPRTCAITGATWPPHQRAHVITNFDENDRPSRGTSAPKMGRMVNATTRRHRAGGRRAWHHTAVTRQWQAGAGSSRT
jgi:transcriptional regulator with XRE-family HTH domain